MENFKMPENWQALDDDERKNYFTVQVDDYIALGTHDYEIGRGENAVTVPELRRKIGSQLMQAKTVKYSTQTLFGKHIRVEGV